MSALTPACRRNHCFVLRQLDYSSHKMHLFIIKAVMNHRRRQFSVRPLSFDHPHSYFDISNCTVKQFIAYTTSFKNLCSKFVAVPLPSTDTTLPCLCPSGLSLLGRHSSSCWPAVAVDLCRSVGPPGSPSPWQFSHCH